MCLSELGLTRPCKQVQTRQLSARLYCACATTTVLSLCCSGIKLLLRASVQVALGIDDAYLQPLHRGHVDLFKCGCLLVLTGQSAPRFWKM